MSALTIALLVVGWALIVMGLVVIFGGGAKPGDRMWARAFAEEQPALVELMVSPPIVPACDLPLERSFHMANSRTDEVFEVVAADPPDGGCQKLTVCRNG